jgi:small-conductance mechanosensitive channel
MADLLSQPWFWPAAVIVVVLPIVLLALTELQNALVRAGSAAAKIVALLRNFVVPVGGLLLLLSTATNVKAPEFTWTRVVATVFGFLVILVLLSGLNFAFFVTARRGTWRHRLPSIFVDMARVLVIVISLAVLFSVVWNADVGGLFTALGIGSIVIGLALQNAVGSILSGLLLLFEQPFQLDDYLVTAYGKGKIVEVNWRAVHLDTGNGIRVVPNSALADGSFVNITRSADPYEASTIVRFASDDPPQEVVDLLLSTAADLPRRHPDADPSASPVGKSKYAINIPVIGPHDESKTLGTFRLRLWYAARRADLHLDDDLTDNFRTDERLLAALRLFAPALYLNGEDADALADKVRLERYGEGEVVQRAGGVPDGMRFLLDGSATLGTPLADGSILPIARLGRKDMLGLAALTRQMVATTATATTDLSLLFVPVAVLDTLVKTRPALARDIGIEIDNRRELALKALKAAGQTVPIDSLILA